MISEFLKELDTRWNGNDLGVTGRIPLKIIGSTALMLQTGRSWGTKDSDVLETHDIPIAVRARLLELAGPGSELFKRHRLYIDIVSPGIPFLAEEPEWLPLHELNRELRHFSVEALAIADVMVAKLVRYNAHDRRDVELMVDENLVDHGHFIARLKSAVQRVWYDARAEDLPKVIARVHALERDHFFEDETPIELPAWVEADDED